MSNLVKLDSIGSAIDLHAFDTNEDFGILKLNFLSDGYNSHEIPITNEMLKKYAHTVLGKFIVAKYDKLIGDVQGHEVDEVIVGYIPQSATLEFEESDNGLFACVEGLISKVYANEVYQLYTTNNHRAVSVEMELLTDPNTEELLGFKIAGVTLLGLHINPSCKLAKSTMVRFSNECELFYNSKQNSRLEKLGGTLYKVDTTELKNDDWGKIDKNIMRDKILQSANRTTLVNKVYALVEKGWEVSPSTKLKYPLMQLVGDTFYYNREALSSALVYAKQNKEEEVIVKIEKLYKQFDLKEGENENMAKLEIEGRKAWGEVIAEVQAHEGENAYVDSIEKDHIIYTVDDVRYRVEAEVEVDDDDKTVEADIKWDTKKEDKDQKMSAEEKLENPIEKEEELEEETVADEPCEEEEETEEETDVEEMACKLEEVKATLADKEHIIMEQEEELAELREFKEEILNERKEKLVAETLQEIKTVLSDEEYAKLETEGKACDYENLTAWQNSVKALAFDKGATKLDNKGVVFTEVKLNKIGGVNTEVETHLLSSSGLWTIK